MDYTKIHHVQEPKTYYSTFFTKDFIELRDAINKFIKKQDYTVSALTSFAEKNLGSIIQAFWFPAIAFILSFLCAPIIPCFIKKKKPYFKNKMARTILVVVAFILFLVACLGFIDVQKEWSGHLQKTVEQTDNIACAAEVILHELKHGYKDSTYTFAGMGGIKYFLNTLKTETSAIQDITELDNIVKRDFPTQNTEIYASLKNYYDQFKSSTCLSCQPGSTTQVQSGLISQLTPEIRPEVKTEFDQVTQVGEILNTAAKAIKDVVTGDEGGQQIIDTVDNVMVSLHSIDDSLDEIQKAILEDSDYSTYMDETTEARDIANTAFYCLIGLNALIVLLMIAISKKSTLFRYTAKCCVFTQCCVGAIITLGGFALVVSSVILSNACYFYDESLNDRSILKSFVNEGVFKIADTCMYKDSTGDLTYLMGDDESHQEIIDQLDQFKEIGNLLDFIEPFEAITESVTLSHLKTEILEKMKTFEIEDPLPKDDSFTFNVYLINQIAQSFVSSDSFVMNSNSCPEGYQVSKSTDSPMTSKGVNYCLVIPELSYDNIDPRYAPQTQANLNFESLRNCAKSHTELIQNMITALDTSQGPLALSRTYFSGLHASKDDAVFILDKLADTVDFLKNMQSSITDIFNCKIARNHLLIARDMLCHEDHGFISQFSFQAYYITLLGSLISMTSLCLCINACIAFRLKKTGQRPVDDGRYQTLQTRNNNQNAYHSPPELTNQQPFSDFNEIERQKNSHALDAKLNGKQKVNQQTSF